MELFKLFGSIAIKDTNVKSKLGEVDKKASNTASRLKSLGKSTSDVGKTMSLWATGPIVAAGVGIMALATKTGNAADRILDLADITGLSTDAIQEYQHVAKIAGVNTEAVTRATEGFIRRLPQIQSEGGASAEAMDKLRVSTEGTAEEIMDNMIVALAAIEDPMERNKLGAQLFGGAWKDMAPILAMGTEGIAEARQQAHELGVVMGDEALNKANDFRVGMEELRARIQGLTQEIGAKLVPVLLDVVLPAIEEHVIPAIIKLSEVVVKLIEWFGDLDPVIQKAILAFVAIVAAIGPLLVIVGKVMTAISTLMPVITKIIGVIKSLGVVVKALIAIKKALLVVFAALTGPIGLAIAAVAALAAGAYLLITNWESVVNFFKGFISFFRGIFAGLADWVGNIFQTIGDVIVGRFRMAVELVKNIAKGIVNTIIGMLNSFAEQVNRIIRTFNKVPGVNLPTIGTIPKLADGGKIRQEGSAIVGEEGPELLSLPSGAKVTPLDKKGQGQGVTINIIEPKLFNEKDADKLGELLYSRMRHMGYA